VPFTVLCATFFAVITVLFATFLAVRTGPACALSTLPTQRPNARNTENNAFMVSKVSWQRRHMRLSAGQLAHWQLPEANRARKYPFSFFSIDDFDMEQWRDSLDSAKSAARTS